MRSSDHAQLVALGWDQWFGDRFARVAAPDQRPARVVADHGAGRVVHDGRDELPAGLGRRIAAAARGDHPTPPVVGDWVAVSGAGHRVLIEAVLERRSAFRRAAAGPVTADQPLAANVDVALVLAGLDGDLNARRVERYLALAWSGGAQPVVLLTKADLASGARAEGSLAGAERIAGAAPVLAVSARTGDGLERLVALLPPGRTAVLLGPSGVGKSTLVNRLAGADVMRTGAIRPDGKGRHTTSHRQLVLLPWGGLLVDTPGLRELQLWDAAEGVDRLFADVDELAARCRFADCRHGVEPGCAVREAIARGELSEGRLTSYRKLHREAAATDRRTAQRRDRVAALGRRRRIARLREEDLPL